MLLFYFFTCFIFFIFLAVTRLSLTQWSSKIKMIMRLACVSKMVLNLLKEYIEKQENALIWITYSVVTNLCAEEEHPP